MSDARPAPLGLQAQKECKLSQVVNQAKNGSDLQIIRTSTFAEVSEPPTITHIWYDQIMHPAGAYRSVAVIHTYIDWSDGAQTSRPGLAPWLCVHRGTGWPDAYECCEHIAAIEGDL